jgi:hypothetical protein
MTVAAQALVAGQRVKVAGTTYSVVAARPRYQYNAQSAGRVRGPLKHMSIALAAAGQPARQLLALPAEQFEVIA